MDCSTPGFRVPHHLLQFARSCSLHWWCCPAILSSDTFFSFCPQFFPISGTFPMSHLFALDDQNTGASASASVLPVNIQGWSPLRFTGLISFLSKALSVGFSSSTIPGINSLAFCLLYGPALTKTDHWQGHQFSSVAQLCPTLCDPMNCSTPGFPVLHHLPEFAQAHVHQVGNAIQPPHPLERGNKGGREGERCINWSVFSSTSCKDTSPVGFGPFSYDLI